MSGAALAALESGRAYVNVHTRRNPAGEIRGQIPALALTLS
ncbi:MAG: CHRD domain-containing protein [Actinomycetota bacterium]|nr:CHRD domain-containing protein [Actinomycetota bacterium]